MSERARSTKHVDQFHFEQDAKLARKFGPYWSQGTNRFDAPRFVTKRKQLLEKSKRLRAVDELVIRGNLTTHACAPAMIVRQMGWWPRTAKRRWL